MFGQTFLLLLLVSACGLFQARPSLQDKKMEDLLAMIKTTGEGKGRTTSNGQQNVFGFESGLKPDTDWILAVSIPLHGEEVMVVPNLKDASTSEISPDGFDQRLLSALTQELGSKKEAREHMQSLRSLLRFLNTKTLSLAPQCEHEKGKSLCKLDGKEFRLQVVKDTLELQADEKITVIARNLTDSFFSQTVFSLRSAQKEIMSLELFWKD